MVHSVDVTLRRTAFSTYDHKPCGVSAEKGVRILNFSVGFSYRSMTVKLAPMQRPPILLMNLSGIPFDRPRERIGRIRYEVKLKIAVRNRRLSKISVRLLARTKNSWFRAVNNSPRTTTSVVGLRGSDVR
jgi:hypothetical protein